ncbi:MAG: ANTAR domain-containing response regulator [Fimbriimonadaceae bacterium]|jgi:response regulator NasT
MANMRVLIADDEPIIRLDLRQMLESMDYEVVAEAQDGQEAIDMAKDTSPDVCILDVKMPILDGIEAAKTLFDEGFGPCILLTAYSDRELIERAKEAGVYAYLVKPFKPSDLAPAIEIARAAYDTHVKLSEEIEEMHDRIEARKVIDRAKGILMDDYGMTEAEAYRRIQVQSMNIRKSMREVAEAIILAKSIQA